MAIFRSFILDPNRHLRFLLGVSSGLPVSSSHSCLLTTTAETPARVPTVPTLGNQQGQSSRGSNGTNLVQPTNRSLPLQLTYQNLPPRGDMVQPSAIGFGKKTPPNRKGLCTLRGQVPAGSEDACLWRGETWDIVNILQNY